MARVCFPQAFVAVLGAGLLLAVSGCGSTDPDRPYPVRGQVLFRGKPAEGARVTFIPRGPAGSHLPRPTAAVEHDGTFRLTTRLAYDGAPVGRYAVTIVYLSPAKKVDDENAGPDLLRGKYRDPKTTPLEVEITAGDNELPPIRVP